jgi:hypothetical protein
VGGVERAREKRPTERKIFVAKNKFVDGRGGLG